uniref:Secreted protein n=1 Tax=Globodera rostochiensis TaxID=31243 RepID=A0A914IDY7_GLORO
MIFYSFYWAKTAFVSLLMMSSITFEATCSGPVSALFNSLIVGITSANEGEHSAASNSNQRPLELKLADAQMLQQWIGQIARKIVVEDGIFAGNYSRGPNININAVILTDGLPNKRIKKIDKNLLKELKEVQNLEQKGQFLKLLFSFGAMLSAEIGEQSQQNGTLRAILKAYECVGEQFNGISDFVIAAVIKNSYEGLKVDKIILESQPIDNLNHLNHRLIQEEFTFLNALNIQMTPKDIINFASFIKSNFLTSPINPFAKSFLKKNGLSISNLDTDPVKSRRIAYQLLLHLKNWGLKELEEISLESYVKDNLLQRMAKFELLDDYFGELNIGDLVNYAKDQMKYFERLSAENCYENRRKEWGEGNELKQQNKPKKENEGIENSKIYPFLDEAIRIDWNVWKEIIQQIDQLKFYVPPKNAEGGLKHFLEVNVEAQLFELFYSFAARLEAIVHGKNIDGTIKKSPENSKDKIRAFLAVPNCFNVPEWPNKFSIFDYWMEIKDFNPKKSQIPVIGVAIPIFWKIDENEEAKSISRESYKTLKALNEYKFAFYESTKLLINTYDKIESCRSSSNDMIIPEIITNPLNQISSENAFKWKNDNYVYNQYGDHIRGYVTLDKDSLDSKHQGYVEQDFEKFCKILERMDSRVEEAKIAFLNNVRYDLVIDFKLNAWKDVHDITKDLLGKWTKEKLTEETTFAEGNEKYMLEQFKEFTTEINRKKISKIEALKAKEKDGYDLLGLFDRLGELVRKIIKEEMPNLEKAKKELINLKGEKEKKETEEEIKRIMKLVESAREMGKNLEQMLEDVKKNYGQKMVE